MAAPMPAPAGGPDLIARHPSPPAGAAWAADARAAAAVRLQSMGAPVKRHEYWRYTDPAGLTSAVPDPALVLPPEDPAVFGGVACLRLVFVDGVFDPGASDPLEMAGIEIAPIADALSADIHWARDLFGVLEARGQAKVDRPLAALNTAVASNGMAVRVTATPPKPIAFHYIHADQRSDAVLHHLIKVEPGASATVLETGPAAARFNKAMEIDVADGGALHHIRVQGPDHQRRAATHNFARLGRESVFKSFTLTVNGALTRNEAVIEFTGDGGVAHIAGASVGNGDFHHDDTVFVTHDGVGCESRQVFKKVLRSGATGVFQGKILVKEGAQKTDGYQISQGLILDEESQFLAKPELEIYADDVACSHGSTCGAVDETLLFYLTSRGIPKAAAEDMLILAFLDEAVAEIEDQTLAEAIRDRLNHWLAERHAG